MYTFYFTHNHSESNSTAIIDCELSCSYPLTAITRTEKLVSKIRTSVRTTGFRRRDYVTSVLNWRSWWLSPASTQIHNRMVQQQASYTKYYTHTHGVLWCRCIYFHASVHYVFYSLEFKVPKLRVSQFTSPNSVSSFLTHTLHSANQRNGFNSWPASTSSFYLLHHAYPSDSFSSSCLPPRPCYPVFTVQ